MSPAGTWICISQGFPNIPFFVNEDLTRPDGVIRCRQLTDAEAGLLSWKEARALITLLRGIGIVFG